MIEILKYFISMCIDVFNTVFLMEITLSDDLTAPLGLLLIAVVIFVILILLVCKFFNINIGGDDE